MQVNNKVNVDITASDRLPNIFPAYLTCYYQTVEKSGLCGGTEKRTT